jgi:hypothetical protein
MVQHIPPDILDLIKKSGREVKKISHEDAQGKEAPTQGKVINGPIDENVQS